VVAEQLRRAATGLGKLTGRVDVEDILDVIFREFCVGKSGRLSSATTHCAS
jgi:tRNA modification GTPase